MDNEQARKYIKNINEAYIEILNEARLASKDKRAIMKLVTSPKNTEYKMEDGTILKTKKMEDGIHFMFDKENFELSVTIVDIVDEMVEYDHDAKPGDIRVMKIK